MADEHNNLMRHERALDEDTNQFIRYLGEASVAASQAWCRSFSSTFMSKLPSELRDMVFDYTFSQDSKPYTLWFEHDLWELHNSHRTKWSEAVAKGGPPPLQTRTSSERDSL
ncbi:predicted protein [Pyrenophora tritici-repentis Pt-1C-BFP]|uniref:Uncharacterized protein n=1 Tax=Pyrenophora tritici-repentis (strain Pt-1C-BFP) TaxID=426418 RepID=B2W980_PYRTR|nr:uncharacterized protein PTRG_06538 [Pyrenophora tritici-repentis Pt-1C-BFP]EDU49458.1 predicted protein [Pyrenophora tritici-repentis Pt-1C-BFP]